MSKFMKISLAFAATFVAAKLETSDNMRSVTINADGSMGEEAPTFVQTQAVVNTNTDKKGRRPLAAQKPVPASSLVQTHANKAAAPVNAKKSFEKKTLSKEVAQEAGKKAADKQKTVLARDGASMMEGKKAKAQQHTTVTAASTAAAASTDTDETESTETDATTSGGEDAGGDDATEGGDATEEGGDEEEEGDADAGAVSTVLSTAVVLGVAAVNLF